MRGGFRILCAVILLLPYSTAQTQGDASPEAVNAICDVIANITFVLYTAVAVVYVLGIPAVPAIVWYKRKKAVEAVVAAAVWVIGMIPINIMLLLAIWIVQLVFTGDKCLPMT